MTFELTDSDGNIVKQIYSCTECIYTSTERHFRQTEDGVRCLLCSAPAEKARTIQQSAGMSDFEYRRMLELLEADVDGIGATTVERIEESFPDGDDFLDAAERAYQDRELSALTEVKGIGESSAEAVALGIAEYKGWENGLAESSFELSP